MFAAIGQMGFSHASVQANVGSSQRNKKRCFAQAGRPPWLVAASLCISPYSCCLVFEAYRSYEQYPEQFSALDALAGMTMKGAAKCDKHAE